MTKSLIVLAALAGAAVVGYVEESRISTLKAEIEISETDRVAAEARAAALAEAMQERGKIDAQAFTERQGMEKVLTEHCEWSAIPVPADVCRRLRGEAYRR